MNQEEILNLIREQFLQYLAEDSFQEGNICYDLSSPFAYAISEIHQKMENSEKDFNLNTLNEKVLLSWAPPRIGERKEASAPQFWIETDVEVFDIDQWYLKNYPDVWFHTENRDDTSILITGNEEKPLEYTISIGAIVVTPENEEIQAHVTRIVSLGSNEESIELYRERYKRSFLVEEDAGTGEYYRNKISAYPGVGIAGVDYIQSKAKGTVMVYITDSSYRIAPTATFCQSVVKYFTSEEHNIVPMNQTLEVHPITMVPCNIQITIIDIKKDLTAKTIREYLWELNSTKYSIELFQTTNLIMNLSIPELRNLIIIRFQDYGTITTVKVNDHEDQVLLDHKLPEWLVIY